MDTSGLSVGMVGVYREHSPLKGEAREDASLGALGYELVSSVSGEQFENFDRITNLNLHIRNKSVPKITRMTEVLHSLRNIQVLNLSYNKITVIENLHFLKDKLLELNLAENSIAAFDENLTSLHRLERLNLSGNRIRRIPSSISNMRNLNSLRIARNDLDVLKDLLQLQPMQSLSKLRIDKNPITDLSHARSFAVFNIPSLSSLDGNDISEEERQQAHTQFSFGGSYSLNSLNSSITNSKGVGAADRSITRNPKESVVVGSSSKSNVSNANAHVNVTSSIDSDRDRDFDADDTQLSFVTAKNMSRYPNEASYQDESDKENSNNNSQLWVNNSSVGRGDNGPIASAKGQGLTLREGSEGRNTGGRSNAGNAAHSAIKNKSVAFDTSDTADADLGDVAPPPPPISYSPHYPLKGAHDRSVPSSSTSSPIGTNYQSPQTQTHSNSDADNDNSSLMYTTPMHMHTQHLRQGRIGTGSLVRPQPPTISPFSVEASPVSAPHVQEQMRVMEHQKINHSSSRNNHHNNSNSPHSPHSFPSDRVDQVDQVDQLDQSYQSSLISASRSHYNHYNPYNTNSGPNVNNADSDTLASSPQINENIVNPVLRGRDREIDNSNGNLYGYSESNNGTEIEIEPSNFDNMGDQDTSVLVHTGASVSAVREMNILRSQLSRSEALLLSANQKLSLTEQKLLVADKETGELTQVSLEVRVMEVITLY